MHAELDPILVKQHSLVTRQQAWEAGLSMRQIDHLLARQLLVPVHRGVFRDPAGPQTMDQRALAAVLASGAGAVVSHRLAVAVRGMPNYQCLLSEISASGRRRIPGIVAHRSARPPDQEVLRGIPITSAARTMVDVGTQIGQALLGRWIETWVSSKLLTLDDLEAQLDDIKGHAGVPVVRGAMTSRTLIKAVADSAAEAELGLLLQRHGFPQLTLHHAVTTTSGLDFELDWSYPDWMIAFELDGYGVHLRSLDAFEHDRIRRNELVIDGWSILNFTARMLRNRPKTIISQVERSLRGQTLVS
jgi:hypothetical protein